MENCPHVSPRVRRVDRLHLHNIHLLMEVNPFWARNPELAANFMATLMENNIFSGSSHRTEDGQVFNVLIKSFPSRSSRRSFNYREFFARPFLSLTGLASCILLFFHVAAAAAAPWHIRRLETRMKN